VGLFSEGFFKNKLRRSGCPPPLPSSRYIDTTGKMAIALQEFWSAKQFHNGLAQVQTKDRSVGYIDRSGKYIWGPHKPNDIGAE
jgi:hypothetical protein